MQIINILFDNVCHVFELCEFVTIVVRKHAFWTNNGMAKFTEIFDFLVLMFITENFTCAGLSDGNLRLLASLAWIAHGAQLILHRTLGGRTLVETVDVLHEAFEFINFLFLLHHGPQLTLALHLHLLLLRHLRLPKGLLVLDASHLCEDFH